MKILSQPKPKPQEFTCQDATCKTHVECEPSDCRYVTDRDGNCIVWECPTCKRDNWVSIQTVPAVFVGAVSRR